jgi:2-polyprenyl-3-methyl-5-hydroxy-6-metoxy-1,4-benzoquinol methylase
MPNYGDRKYWEDRYKVQDGNTFDWLEDYETLKPIIENLNLDKNNSITLVLGCGNAEFSEKICRDGYSNIYNIDIAGNVIETMRERNKELNMICIIYLI